MMSDFVKIIDFKSIGQPELGYISVAEYGDNIDFDIKRVFWSYYTPHHITRGRHAHYKLCQVLIAVSGIISVETIARDGDKKEFVLDSPDRGLYLPPHYWHVMRFSHNAVLLSLASLEYAEDDYIRDYDEFMKG
ncbi:MAG: WxcM-like domain-containing protein [Flavobacteriales bacterium]|nr:WxcM-like domain-containing protein [Flavobacteriales bacterium]